MNHVMLGKTISREMWENEEFNEHDQRKGQKWKGKKKGNYKYNRDSTQGPLGFGFWVCVLALRFACECFAQLSLSLSHAHTYPHFLSLSLITLFFLSFFFLGVLDNLGVVGFLICQVIAGCNMLQKILFLFLFYTYFTICFGNAINTYI